MVDRSSFPIFKKAASRSMRYVLVMLPDETIQSTFCDCCQQFGRYDLLLVEQSDFRRGTSSRSIKFVHGSVRYLQQGNIEWENDKMA
jgi:hypothetical protein